MFFAYKNPVLWILNLWNLGRNICVFSGQTCTGLLQCFVMHHVEKKTAMSSAQARNIETILAAMHPCSPAGIPMRQPDKVRKDR